MVVEFFDGSAWLEASNQKATPEVCAPNTVNRISFSPITAEQIRVVFHRNVAKDYYVGITEFEIWATWPQAATPDTYEAEDGYLRGGARIEASQMASSGSYVGDINIDSSSVEFAGVWADQAGEYSLRIYYANGQGVLATHNILINNDYYVIASYQPTGSWGVFESSVTIPVTLQRGNNVLVFKHANNFAEIDKIQVLF